VNVREALVSDAPTIAGVHVASWKGAYRGLMADEVLDSLSIRSRTEAWERNLADPNWAALVALNEREIVGFAHLCACRDPDKDKAQFGEVAALYVLPSFWGQGFGAALMLRSVQALRSRSYTEVTAWVLERNHRALEFYAAWGLRADGERKVHPASGLTEVRYVGSLTATEHDGGHSIGGTARSLGTD
jgi:GNAT superfamily N-acetyltransferase